MAKLQSLVKMSGRLPETPVHAGFRDRESGLYTHAYMTEMTHLPHMHEQWQ